MVITLLQVSEHHQSGWLLLCLQSRATFHPRAKAHKHHVSYYSCCFQTRTNITHLLLLKLFAKLFCSLPSFFQLHIWFFQKLFLFFCFCQQVHSSYNHLFLQRRQFLQQGLVLLSRETGRVENLLSLGTHKAARSSSVLQPRQHSQGWKNLSGCQGFTWGWGSASESTDFLNSSSHHFHAG